MEKKYTDEEYKRAGELYVSIIKVDATKITTGVIQADKITINSTLDK